MIKITGIQVSDRTNNECIELLIELLKEGKMIRTKTLGGSMFPVIEKDDSLIIKPVTFSKIKIGDIIAYRKKGGNGLLTGHRTIKKKRNSNSEFLITKGDANNFFDFPVYADEVYGKVTQIEKEGEIIKLDTLLSKSLSYFYAKVSWIQTYINALFR